MGRYQVARLWLFIRKLGWIYHAIWLFMFFYSGAYFVAVLFRVSFFDVGITDYAHLVWGFVLTVSSFIAGSFYFYEPDAITKGEVRR